MTDRYRGTVNFDYWRARCNAEQTDESHAADVDVDLVRVDVFGSDEDALEERDRGAKL